MLMLKTCLIIFFQVFVSANNLSALSFALNIDAVLLTLAGHQRMVQ